MAHSKKTRKVGLIGVRKDPNYKRPTPTGPAKPKKHKGKPAGSRHNVDQPDNKANATGNASKDPRHGSKKPVPLVKQATTVPGVRKKYASPAQELAALEADEKLASLLDKIDGGDTLTRAQQAYVDEKMARHKVLCDLMGISESADNESDDDHDPLGDLDAFSMDDFKR